MAYLTMAAGVYLTGFAFICDTPDFKSTVIIRAIPGLIGVGNLLAGAHMAGLI